MIDLRSDTVTRPTDAMREKMHRADVGDDVYGEDPTVAALETRAAERLGREAAVFVPSGTQANLISILTHCDRGDEYIVGRPYHSFAREGGGAAALGGVQPAPVEVDSDGAVPTESIRSAIKPDDDPHFARTRMIALENPTGGRVQPVEYIREVAAIADAHDLALHLDGARLFNAATSLQVSARALAEPADSVWFSLSKGLGAPVGAVVCGPTRFIEQARRWRKMVGGGMRQAGIVAAGGLHALDHHLDRLEEDHRNARRLAEGLNEVDGIRVDLESVETNMVFAELHRGDTDELESFLADRDIHIHPHSPLRLVTHIDVSADDVDRTTSAFETYFDQI